MEFADVVDYALVAEFDSVKYQSMNNAKIHLKSIAKC
jgi:hypothetical protein